MEGINCQYGTYIIKISCTFAFDAVAELESSGGDGSLMSSASSTCAFFEPDLALAVPVELSLLFAFCSLNPLCGAGELLDHIQQQSWWQDCRQAYQNQY